MSNKYYYINLMFFYKLNNNQKTYLNFVQTSKILYKISHLLFTYNLFLVHLKA